MADDLEAARVAELAKLGPNGVKRVAAVSTWLDAKGMAGLKPMLATAESVENFEHLIRDNSSRPAPQPQPASHQASGDGRVTDEAYAKMTPREKYVYAQQQTAAHRR
jgi:hypothetical protein